MFTLKLHPHGPVPKRRNFYAKKLQLILLLQVTCASKILQHFKIWIKSDSFWLLQKLATSWWRKRNCHQNEIKWHQGGRNACMKSCLFAGFLCVWKWRGSWYVVRSMQQKCRHWETNHSKSNSTLFMWKLEALTKCNQSVRIIEKIPFILIQ